MSESCPSEKQLRQLIDGAIADAEAIVLEQHLDRCGTCQQTVKQMTQDGTFWNSVTASLAESPAVGPELDRVIGELQQQSPEDAEQMGEVIELRMSSVEPPTEPGTIGRLKHYDILRVAGRGGMGIVLKAFDRSLRRIVAVKLLAPHLAGNGLARQRFIREGRAAAAITHQHVITIHAVEESPPFLVMQYVQGETLEGRIHRNGAMDVKDAIRVAMQIAQGLAAAHAQGVVHRDIKPANILLENGIARVRITDFGLARAIDDASLTQSGVIAGTPQYMAPEQASGDAIDERADLFSLGSVLYTMLAGHAPFRANTAMGVLKRLCDHAPRSIREINPDTPDWLMLIVNRLHAKRAADRFGSAAEVAMLLEKGLAAMQSGSAMQVPPMLQADAEAISFNGKPQATASFIKSPHATAISPARTLPQKLLRPGVLFAVLALLALPFVWQASVLGAVFSVLSLLVPKLAPKLTAGLFHHAPDAATADPQAAGLARSALQETADEGGFWRELKKMPTIRRIIWLLVWVSPAVVWTVDFFGNESLAVYSRNSRRMLGDYYDNIVFMAWFMLAAWIVIGMFFFRQRTPEGTRLFSKPTGRTGLLVTTGLAALFCTCGYGTWLSDVYSPAIAQQLNRHLVASGALPVVTVQSKHQLLVQLLKPTPGMYVIIDGDNIPACRVNVEDAGGPGGGMVSTTFVHLNDGSGTGRWRAFVGDSEFASGELVLPDGFSTHFIQVPAARLSQLIKGTWMSRKAGNGAHSSSPVAVYPGRARAEDPSALTFEFHHSVAITRGVFLHENAVGRNDLQFEIDETTTPASITFTDSKGVKTHGIIRFQPGVLDGGMSGGMMGMGGYGGNSIDTLTICLSGTGTVRPWEFKADKRLGIVLYDLVRSSESSLIFEPLPADSTPTAIEESLHAWTKRLNVPRHQTNSLGIEMLLVPPATGVTEKSRMIDLPDLKHSEYVYSEYVYPGGKTVEYPFAISRDPISSQQFALFVKETNYVTDAERGLPLPEGDATQTIGGWTYHKGSADATARCEWTTDLNWKLAEDATVTTDDQSHGDESSQSRPVQVISHNDAVAYCAWISKQESRLYRLPTLAEIIVATQLSSLTGAPLKNLKAPTAETPNLFQVQASGLTLNRVPGIVAEWTSQEPEIVATAKHKELLMRSADENANADPPFSYIALPEFRSTGISFRVVGEIQVLKPKD